MQHLKERNDVAIRLSQKQVANSKGGDGYG